MVTAPAAARVSAAVQEPPPWVDAAIDEPGEGLAVATRPAALAPATAVERDAAPLVPTALGDRWAALVREVVEAGRIAALVRELAMQSQCVLIDDAGGPWRCRLRVEREMLRAPAQVEKLQSALTEHLQRPVTLETESGATADTPARRDAAERQRRQAQAEQIIQDDPLVRALMAQYATARIVPGSVKPH
jgi:DNA polymerase-3 subunit gamma/tau